MLIIHGPKYRYEYFRIYMNYWITTRLVNYPSIESRISYGWKDLCEHLCYENASGIPLYRTNYINIYLSIEAIKPRNKATVKSVFL